MSKIFINYRRDDSAGHAGRLYDRLSDHFGKDNIFMDVDQVPLGTNFVKAIEDAVDACDALIVLIGEQWLSLTDSAGRRRLDIPEDFVKLEIETAIERNVPVIPVLIEDTAMPQESELPEPIISLVQHQGLSLRHASFNSDAGRLINGLVETLGLEGNASLDIEPTPRGSVKKPPLEEEPETPRSNTEQLSKRPVRTWAYTILVFLVFAVGGFFAGFQSFYWLGNSDAGALTVMVLVWLVGIVLTIFVWKRLR